MSFLLKKHRKNKTTHIYIQIYIFLHQTTDKTEWPDNKKQIKWSCFSVFLYCSFDLAMTKDSLVRVSRRVAGVHQVDRATLFLFAFLRNRRPRLIAKWHSTAFSFLDWQRKTKLHRFAFVLPISFVFSSSFPVFLTDARSSVTKGGALKLPLFFHNNTQI